MILLLFFSQFAFSADSSITCKVDFRNIVNNQLVEKSVEMPTAPAGFNYIRHEIELDDRYLSVLEETKTHDIRIIITKAPDYTTGTLSEGQLGADGSISQSQVEGNLVYKVTCKKK